MVAAETMDGFSVEIRQDSIDIRCDATNGYSTPIKFQINGFDDVAERTFDFHRILISAQALIASLRSSLETVTSSQLTTTPPNSQKG